MTKKKIFTIAGIAVGAVIVIGIVIWLIFFRGGSVAPSDPNEMVYVTSVADITGTGSLGMTAKYSGVVEPEKTLSVQKDDTKKIAELYVTVGQEVKLAISCSATIRTTCKCSLKRRSYSWKALKTAFPR